MVYNFANWFINMAEWFMNLEILSKYCSTFVKYCQSLSKYCSNVPCILRKIMSKNGSNIGLVLYNPCYLSKLFSYAERLQKKLGVIC